MPDLLIFAEKYDYSKAMDWCTNHHSFVLKSLVGYIIAIFSIKFFMRDRKPFNLERPLTVWNAFLSIFSALGVFYMTPALYRVIRDHGIAHTYTHVSELETSTAAGYWHFLWVVSKIPEFIDTLFIVTRKKPLITMHWWHHVSSAYTAFVCFGGGSVFLVWCAYLNYLIHAHMYAYYALRSLGVLVPPQIAQVITFAQIIQMMAWNAVYTHLIWLSLTTNQPLAYTTYGLFCAFFTTNSLLLMWFRFYYVSYFKNGGQKYEKHKLSIRTRMSIAHAG